jgi:hypothetical protein
MRMPPLPPPYVFAEDRVDIDLIVADPGLR